MKILQKVKRATFNTAFYKYILAAYHAVFLHGARERRSGFGNENPETTFYLIRIEGMITGILAFYLNVLGDCAYARSRGWVPVVDMKNGKNQYAGIRTEGTSDPWEVFFCQPSDYTAEEVYKSAHVVLSGWTFRKILHPGEKDRKSSFLDCASYREVIDLYRGMGPVIGVSSYMKKAAEPYVRENITPGTLGVFVRGTDYVATRPKGHFVQPSAGQILEKIEEFKKRQPIDRIFLVTEDAGIEEEIRKNAGLPVFTISQPAFGSYSYEKAQYLNQYITKDNVQDNTMKYLIKCICLSKCRYVVTSAASGSFFSELIREEPALEAFHFDLGKY